jgi:hypothetical protein
MLLAPAVVLAAHSMVQAEEPALAETLFQDGRALLAQGRTREACAKFEESLRLDPATGTLLNLAVCHEDLGKFATAWAEFRAASANAHHDGREDRVRFADEHLEHLQPRLSYLNISVGAAARLPGLTVSLDDTVLGHAAWDVATPIDPGTHVVQARADAYQPMRQTVSIGTTASQQTVTVDLVPVWTQRANEPSAATPRLKMAAYTLAGASAASLLVGSVFGIRAFSKWSQRNGQCPTDNSCTTAGVSNYNAAETAATISTVGFGVGVAAAGVSAYLFYRGRSRTEAASATAAWNLRPTAIVPTTSGLVLGWNW